MSKLSFLNLSLVCCLFSSSATFAADPKSKPRPRPTSMTLAIQTSSGTNIPEIKNELEILAWSWGLSSDAEGETGKKEKSGPQMQNISMTKYVGLDSPKLMSLLMKGYQFPTVTLKTSSENGDIVFTMKNAKLASVSTGGSGGETHFTENITFSFDEVLVENSETKDGKTVKSTELLKAK